MSNLFSFILSSYLVIIPVLIIWVIGLIIAIARWSRHPRVSMFATIGLILFILRALVSPWISLLIQQSEISFTQMGIRFSIFNVASAVVAAVGWIFILMAVFGGRSRHETRLEQREVIREDKETDTGWVKEDYFENQEQNEPPASV